MRIRKLLPLTAASLIALSSGAAMADDASVDWSGLYIGAVANLNDNHTHFALPGDMDDVLLADRYKHTSFTGGGLVGFNWQFGSTVLGLDGDLTTGNGTSTVTACNAIDSCFTPAHDSFTTINDLKTSWSGRVRGRIGWSNGDTLFYAGAGYSFAQTKLELTGLCYDAAHPLTPDIYTFSRSELLSGLNLSMGVEHQIDEHFTARIEYVFEDFGGTTYKGEAPEWNDRRIGVKNSAGRIAVAYRL